MKKSIAIFALFSMMLLTSFSEPVEIGGKYNPDTGLLTYEIGGKYNPDTGLLSYEIGGKYNPDTGL